MNPSTELVGNKKNYSKKLILADNELVMEWDSPTNKGRKGWHFEYLCPDIGFSYERPKGFKEGIIGGVSLFLIDIILYFSKINEYVPLLAPTLVLVSLAVLVNAIKKHKPERWTVFYRKDGEIAAYMEHSMAREAEIKAFEKAFSEAVTQYGLHEQNTSQQGHAPDRQ